MGEHANDKARNEFAQELMYSGNDLEVFSGRSQIYLDNEAAIRSSEEYRGSRTKLHYEADWTPALSSYLAGFF